jgi:hypothetical protein
VDEKPSGQKPPGLNRRRFIGALGATAAAGAFLQRGGNANAQSQTYYYQDSFGNVVPAGSGAVALGIYPPPIPAAALPLGGAVAAPDTYEPGATNTTYFSSGYPHFNILLIIVDQMRNPGFWLPGGNSYGQNAVNAAIPNISQLANWSFSFPNYWVAATICGPSRACLLTGLYSQQTCQFRASPSPARETLTPPLLPYNASWNNNGGPVGFPTIGNVLSQSIAIGNSTSNNVSYDCTWIGKWHLSCETGLVDGTVGQNGPKDYGFSDIYSIPNTQSLANPYPPGNNNGYPSPDGYLNGGAGGDFLDSFTQSTPARNVPSFGSNLLTPVSFPGNNFTQLSDAAIAYAFTNGWLPHANSTLNGGNTASGQLNTPWFCAVSFINPHDINDFPYTFGLANNSGNFGVPSFNDSPYYQPPPPINSQQTYYGNSCGSNATCLSIGDSVVINNSTGPYAALPPGLGNNTGAWNWEDLTSSALQYANNGKPGLQWNQITVSDKACGNIQSPGTYNNSTNNWSDPTAWLTFLNYYVWMQSCVDYQVGQVLGTNPGSNSSASPGLKQ